MADGSSVVTTELTSGAGRYGNDGQRVQYASNLEQRIKTKNIRNNGVNYNKFYEIHIFHIVFAITNQLYEKGSNRFRRTL